MDTLTLSRREIRLLEAADRHAAQVAALMEDRRHRPPRPSVWAWSPEERRLVRVG